MLSEQSSFDVVIVADGLRTSLAVALCIVVARKACPRARFHVARVEGGSMGEGLAEEFITKNAERIFYIPTPTFTIDEKKYRIINKVTAMSVSGLKQAIGIDSDILFLRNLPTDFIFRSVPTAVPEHGSHEFPWNRLFALTNLNVPNVKVLLGGGLVTAPWFNAGFICAPDATQFGHIWRMMIDLVNGCDWVPERWPYIDQIALPLTFAQLSDVRTVTYDHVLPGTFNQNLFTWMKDQSYVKSGFVVHHHTRVRLIEQYLNDLIVWTRGEFPIVDDIMREMRPLAKD